MLTFAYLSAKNLENLFDFNEIGNFRSSFSSVLAYSCTTDTHEIVESVSSSIEKVEYVDHNLCRGHVNNRLNQIGGGVNQGHSH